MSPLFYAVGASGMLYQYNLIFFYIMVERNRDDDHPLRANHTTIDDYLSAVSAFPSFESVLWSLFYSFLFTVSISEDIYNTPILNPLQN